MWNKSQDHLPGFGAAQKVALQTPFSLEYPLVLVPRLQPLSLGRASEPFSHPDWLFEIKWDGFRSLVRIEQGKCRLVSRKGNDFKSFRTLSESLLAELKVRSAVLDGEIVCLNDAGKPEFRDLLFRRGEPRFVAFDLLWYDGQDLRYSPLTERKHKLRSILPASSERILYCDHVEGDGESLFQLACDSDLEGIVAKRKFDPILTLKSRRVGSRFGIPRIRNGKGGRSFSIVNGRPILIFRSGMGT